MTNNPLLNKFENRFGSIPFDEIETKHFLPAIDESLKVAESNIKNIINSDKEPNFYNVIEALELATDNFDMVTGIYFSLYNLKSDKEFAALAEEISPIIAKFKGEIFTNTELFSKIKTIYEQKDKLVLSDEENRLLEQTYKSFTRNGALLKSDDKDELKQIDQELSVLSPKFSANVLDATNDFFIHVEKEEDVKGIPETAISAARHEAEKRGFNKGWVFTLQMPSYFPVLQYAENRELRKKLSEAYGDKNLAGEFDNREIVLKTVQLRDKRAKLLGYKNHSAFVLENRMAKTPEKVMNFLDEIFKVAHPAAEKELSDIKAEAIECDSLSHLEKWDISYYTQKVKKKKFDFDAEVLRPYFESNNVIDGVFKVAEKLYQLNFVENKDIPVYHPSVKAFEVNDSDSKHLGLLYVDLFPRESKRSGAWMDTFRPQGLQGVDDLAVKRPHILISGNLTPSSKDNPALLSFDEVRTIFHEFGHALHGLLSDVKYCSLGCTNVYWDFVELPSQIMENWLLEKETLNLFAKHYKTGELLPEKYIKKIKETQTFNAGNFNNRQLSLGYLDMAWHTTDPYKIKDVIEFENDVMEKTRLIPYSGGNTSTGFSHIFAGGYSSGYYSYKWAEVLDADAFEYFKEKGIFNAEVAKSFRENILSKGNTEDPMTLYKKFRGKEPDSKALLKRDGLIS